MKTTDRGAAGTAGRLAFVALGSNLGDCRGIVCQALDRLQELSSEQILRSSIWQTTPVECPPGSPDFVNAVAGLVPLEGETPESLLEKLQVFEWSLGRTR